MYKIITTVLSTLALTGFLVACDKNPVSVEAQASTPPASTPVTASAPASTTTPAAKNTLLFFMNPGGVPCQIQERILNELGSQLTDQVTVVKINTEVPADRPTFNQYGIRALPTLVILDSAQKEVLRLPPGIQQGDYLVQALGAVRLAAK